MEANGKRFLKGSRKDLIFYCVMMLWPVAQFCVFYIGVNFNSFLLTFQNIDMSSGTTTWTLGNFSKIFAELPLNNFMTMLKNSVVAWLLSVVISVPLGLLFSYYIYKKMPLYGAFRAILFLPSIVSSIVMVTMFRYFVSSAMPAMAEDFFGASMPGILDPANGIAFGVIMFYNIWVGFGTSVLMYSNGMSGISPEIVDSAHIDGATGLNEFIHITLPLVFPTLSVFLVTGVAGIFINQINLYSFYGSAAHDSLQTFGYYLYMAVKRADNDYASYPRLAAFGFMLTCVAVPLTLLVRKLLDVIGPKED